MDLRLSTVVAVILATLCAVVSSMSIPSDQLKDDSVQLDTENTGLDEGRRATWLETRDLEDNFKELVFLTMQELASEGRIDPRVLLDTQHKATKRGRWQGFCFRRTKSGRYLPYICWKGDRK